MANKGNPIRLADNNLLSALWELLRPGNADLFAFGAKDSVARLGEYAGYMNMLGSSDGEPLIHTIHVLLPPERAGDSAAMHAEFEAGFRTAFRKASGSNEVGDLEKERFKAIELRHAKDFSSDTLIGEFAAAREGEALIVGDVSHYRMDAIADGAVSLSEDEDAWCAAAAKLMVEAQKIAEVRKSYILLDAARILPRRKANRDLLNSTGNAGVVGFEPSENGEAEKMQARFVEMGRLVDEGNIGAALDFVEKQADLSQLQKQATRLEALHRAELSDQVRAELKLIEPFFAEIAPQALLRIAMIAAEADSDDLAQALIERILPELKSRMLLELAFEVAVESRRQALIELVRKPLESLHPGSEKLRAYAADRALQLGDFQQAGNLLAGAANEAQKEIAPMYLALDGAWKRALSASSIDPLALAAELVGTFPKYAVRIRTELVNAFERAGSRQASLALLFHSGADWSESWFQVARGLYEHGLAAADPAIDDEALAALVDQAMAHLAEHPGEGLVRIAIVALTDPTRSGAAGLAALVAVAIARAGRPMKTSAAPLPSDRPRLEDLSVLPQIMKDVLVWMKAEGRGTVVLGKHIPPRDLIKADPDAAIAGFARMVERYAPDARDPADTAMLQNIAVVASAIAPHATDPDADLLVLQAVAVKLAIAGQGQVARDLVEHALVTAGHRPRRRRRALGAFADVYARLGMTREALIALGAAFGATNEASWDDIWNEQNLLYRLLRDTGLLELARDVIARMRDALKALGLEEQFGARVDTFDLQVRDMMRRRGRAEAESLEDLLAAATENASGLLDSGEELLPVTVVLQQLVNDAERGGIPVPTATTDLLARIPERLPPAYRAVARASVAKPALADVVAVAGAIAPARYGTDASYDLRQARVIADRLARQAVESGDAEAFLYAAETLGEHGLLVRQPDGAAAVPEPLLADGAAPLESAKDLAALDLPLFFFALDSDGLMAASVTGDGVSAPVAVSADLFAPEAFVEWRKTYPAHYKYDKLTDVDFRDATKALGVPQLPERALVFSSELSNLPLNVLTVGGDLAGTTRALATAPSLAWLKASVEAGRSGNGTAAAWIPIANDLPDTATLTLLRNDVEGVLAAADVPLNTQSRPPADLAGVDVAILGAHGGLAEENRFFRAISDDHHDPADLSQLTDVIRGARVAILFICSGGRVDLHPESGGPVGLAQKLLAQGLDAVIAPSWPIEFHAASPWLEAFLARWNAGDMLIDAYHAGNLGVAKASSYTLRRTLAMALHGNPYLTHG